MKISPVALSSTIHERARRTGETDVATLPGQVTPGQEPGSG